MTDFWKRVAANEIELLANGFCSHPFPFHCQSKADAFSANNGHQNGSVGLTSASPSGGPPAVEALSSLSTSLIRSNSGLPQQPASIRRRDRSYGPGRSFARVLTPARPDQANHRKGIKLDAFQIGEASDRAHLQRLPLCVGRRPRVADEKYPLSGG